jgi:hypothetical protein
MYVCSAFLCFCRIYIRLQPFRHFFNCKVYTKKGRELRTFVHSTKRWKSTSFLHFHANSCFCRNLFNIYYFFNWFEIIIKFCVFSTFLIPKSNFLGGRIRTFCQLWTLKPNAHKTAQKHEKSFFQAWIIINYIFQFWFRTSKLLKIVSP